MAVRTVRSGFALQAPEEGCLDGDLLTEAEQLAIARDVARSLRLLRLSQSERLVVQWRVRERLRLAAARQLDLLAGR